MVLLFIRHLGHVQICILCSSPSLMFLFFFNLIHPISQWFVGWSLALLAWWIMSL